MPHHSTALCSRTLRHALLAGGATAAFVGGTAPAAQAACASTPINQSFADSVGDTQFAPDAAALTASLDASCRLTVGYAVSDGYRSYGLLSTDSLVWFLDVDGNAATGSSAGFTGADVGVVRNGSSGIVSRYDATTNAFVFADAVDLTGNFGASLDLSRYAALGDRQMTFAGGTSWKSTSTGNVYYDWLPEVGRAPFATAVSLFEPSPTPTAAPAPAPVVPAPAAAAVAPAPAAAASTLDAEADDDPCEVPRSKGQRLADVKAAIREARCAVGRIRHKSSRTVKTGRVISLSEDAGDFVDAGTRIQITVSTGPSKAAKRLSVRAISRADLLGELNTAAGLEH